MSIEDNKALVRRFFEEAWNKGNPEAVEYCVAASCVSRSGAAAGPLLKRAIGNWHTAFPDFAFRIVRLVAEDDYVVAWVRFTGTHRGVFHHAPAGTRIWGPWEPTGKTVDVPEAWMMRIVAGKIAEIGHVWAGREFIEQLGGDAGSGADHWLKAV
jgi:predicted ester cyclase